MLIHTHTHEKWHTNWYNMLPLLTNACHIFIWEFIYILDLQICKRIITALETQISLEPNSHTHMHNLWLCGPNSCCSSKQSLAFAIEKFFANLRKWIIYMYKFMFECLCSCVFVHQPITLTKRLSFCKRVT